MAAFSSRRLPHYHSPGQPVFLTWRLHGSLPANRPFPVASTSGHSFLAMDRLLDTARSGPLHLTRPAIAQLVKESILHHETTLSHYQLHSWVIMANHVHLLVTPQIPVPQLMKSLKGFTARQANLILHLTGRPFWQDESFDRLVRHDTEFSRITRYIESNPVNAGLVATPAAFPWSSATK